MAFHRNRIILWMYMFTQVFVVLMRLEEFVGPVEQELEWQKYFHVGSFLQKSFVHYFGVFQLVHTDGVGSGTITDSVQWVHYLCRTEHIVLHKRRTIYFLPVEKQKCNLWRDNGVVMCITCVGPRRIVFVYRFEYTVSVMVEIVFRTNVTFYTISMRMNRSNVLMTSIIIRIKRFLFSLRN